MSNESRPTSPAIGNTETANSSSGHKNERIIRIATRHSPLAMWQAEYVASELKSRGFETQLVPLVSSGDIDMRPMDVSAAGETRTVGVFTKRIQQALVDDEADVAVHSMKDLPTAVDDRFVLAAVPVRGDVRDSLVSPGGATLRSLPESAIVGTGSKRRAAQILAHRRDLRVRPIRGNVQTRLAKLQDGEFHAIVLAEAGIERLGMLDLRRETMSTDEMLPAPGQGALAIEVRREDTFCQAAIEPIDDFETHAAVVAERTMLSRLDGGCLAPIAAYADWQDSTLILKALVMSVDGSVLIEDAQMAPVDTIELAKSVGNRSADALEQQGAAELLRR